MKRALSAMFATLVMAACGSSGGDEDTVATSRSPGGETTQAASDTALFRSRAIGFTFRYPKRYVAVTKARDQVLGEVSVSRDARLNAIKVRETADRELTPPHYLDEFQRDFSRTVGKVDERREKIGDLDAGVLEFDDTLDQGAKKIDFTSTSYFFAGAGRTWQVECIADSEHADEIAGACRDALESVEFARRR